MIDLFMYRPEPSEFQVRKVAKIYRSPVHFIGPGQDYPTYEAARASFPHHTWVALEVTNSVTRKTVSDVDWEWKLRQGPVAVITGSMNAGLPSDVLSDISLHVYVPTFDDSGFLSPVSAVSVLMHEIFQKTANGSRVFG